MFSQNFEIMSIVIMCNIAAEFIHAFAKEYIAIKMSGKKNVKKHSTKKCMTENFRAASPCL